MKEAVGVGQHEPGWGGKSLLQRDTRAKARVTRGSADQGKGCARRRGRGWVIRGRCGCNIRDVGRRGRGGDEEEKVARF